MAQPTHAARSLSPLSLSPRADTFHRRAALRLVLRALRGEARPARPVVRNKSATKSAQQGLKKTKFKSCLSLVIHYC